MLLPVAETTMVWTYSRRLLRNHRLALVGVVVLQAGAALAALAVPWMLLLLLAVVGALVWLGIRLSRAAAVRRQEREDERVQEAVQQALNETKPASPGNGEPDPADPEPNPRA